MLSRGATTSLLSLTRPVGWLGWRGIFWWGHDTEEDQAARKKEAKEKERGLISWTDPKKDLDKKEEFVWAPARIEQEAAMVMGYTTGMTNHADLLKWMDRKVVRPNWITWATDPVHFREQMRKKSYQSLVVSQVFLRERLQALGPDLAAAHFLCHRNCKVRFRGHDHWTELEANGALNIPALYVAGWYIEAIEASTANLVYEGLQNFRNLEHLKVRSHHLFSLYKININKKHMWFLTTSIASSITSPITSTSTSFTTGLASLTTVSYSFSYGAETVPYSFTDGFFPDTAGTGKEATLAANLAILRIHLTWRVPSIDYLGIFT